MTRTPVYLDCDTGIDDALALAYLVAQPNADLRGVGTVSGNTDAAQAARNTLDLLAVLGRGDVPVAVGEHDFLTRAYAGGAPHVHGGNGIGGVRLEPAHRPVEETTAAELLVSLARESPGELRVIAIGPLTNLARALELEPRLPELVASVTVMGGAALAPGNVSPVAEANIANDPEAAQAVIAAGWPVTLVPLDVTMAHLLEEPHRQQLAGSDQPVARLLAEMLGHYFEFYRDVFGRGCSAMHDPLAVAIALGGAVPDTAPLVPVVVDTGEGPGRGQTICDLRGRYRGLADVPGATCRVVLRVGADFPGHLTQALSAPVTAEPAEAAR
ncbi:nucleoside hydrolase [Zhihengliuella salsuginis]|uniref:Purine nucleosidase n=1 Tax=Zhihengliuella salsuginis TaxID=578222 RepID=A0ABQ3GKP1_9MICC|nr:nucleoside hydrolase [Zhihengliuella salsuginis]GHD09499.1 purine nucleosidase [Zhihengliuella salsuginis]